MSTSQAVTIRPATLDDYADACQLMDTLDTFHREHLPWMFKEPSSPARSEDHFANSLRSEDSAVFVADAGHLVGIATGSLRTAPALPVFIQQRWGVLDGLVVDPAWRRRGIGKLLVRAVETWAIASGAPWVELNVYEVNAEARRFYEALGYLPLSAKLHKRTTQDV
jgi:ribosomal protein S18 acetylase RimI-like enzyme